MKILTADHVIPISSEPIENGAVVIENDRILAVGTKTELQHEFPAADVAAYGEAAILPGFVNCHSHLELTSMRGALDDVEDDFRSWLLRLNAIRSGSTEDDLGDAAIAGAVEGARAGITCFGDIGRHGVAGLEALKMVGLRGVVFQETEFSPDDRTADDDFANLVEKFVSLRSTETSIVTTGISPHSPYTVGPKLLRLITKFAIENGVKLSIHAGESIDEDELLRTGNGFFTEVYTKFGHEWESPRCSSIEYLDRLGLLASRPLLAHCVTASKSDIDLVAASGASIAHCPKSNAKLGHGVAPFEAFLDSAIPVGLGSDSVASNNTCDILDEARFASLVARTREDCSRFITAREMLESATLGGAAAMGMSDQIGSLAPGKQADIAVLSLSSVAQQPVNHIYSALIFASGARDVVMTMVAGNVIHAAGSKEAAI
jgi:5-methylthioadenosine/S-adenosylhomocysteine deaminase